MLIDSFPLFNELDILELRLTELSPAVDRFVIVESNRTHKGTLKPLHYAENARRFAEWKDKIVHVVVGDMPQGDGLAAIRRREMFQRNAILRGVEDCADDDIILISDCDEIPRLHLLPVALDDGVVVTYIQKLYYFNFNTHAPDRPWPGTRACRVADARALSPHVIRNGLAQSDAHYPRHGHIMNGGWHFSYFGGVDSIQTKMQEFLHQELVTSENTTPEAIAAQVTSGRDIWGREHEQKFVIGAADDLPYAVLRDLPKYAPHFADGWQPVFHEDWYAGGQAIYIGQLARSAPEGAIVEIGCWEGRSTITLAQMVSPRVVHCVDHWMGNIDEGEDHPATIAARERDVYGTFKQNMDRCTAGNVMKWRMDWQQWVESWPTTPAESHCIAFLHLDAAHDYDSVRNCLEAVRPYFVPGAILCGDDAYDARVRSAVCDVFPDAEIVGERLWKVTYAHHD